MRQVLRAISERSVVLSAARIIDLGFGRYEMLFRANGGILASEAIKREFRLHCNCLVGDASQVGSPCPFCIAIRASEIGIAIENIPESTVWECTSCREHSASCGFPNCELRTGCVWHFPPFEDGNHYCLPHFEVMKEQARIDGIREKHGFLAATAVSALKSLMTPPDVAPPAKSRKPSKQIRNHGHGAI